MTTNNPIVKRTALALPKPEDFYCPQIDLFRKFLCNTDEERGALSNVFDLWDSIPRYTISRQQQDKWRKAGTFPLLYEIPFHYRGHELLATIQAATIKDKTGVIKSYFPSANEELIEDVLRKIATEQKNGYFNHQEQRSGVQFTLHMVRQELAKRGHGRTYSEINLSLEIMSSAVIQTTMIVGQDKQFTSKSLYLNNLVRISKYQYTEDPAAKWFVDFHPFASRAFDELTYRQFNYTRLMGHKSQLARWLNKVLSLKYLNASPLYPFEIRLSTIMRNSHLLNGYKRPRDAIAAVESALDELRTCQPALLSGIQEVTLHKGVRGKVLDITYTLRPSPAFVMEMKTASKRQILAREGVTVT